MDSKRKTAVGAAVMLLAAGFIIYGAVRGEAAVVLGKAVNICMECIGLG